MTDEPNPAPRCEPPEGLRGVDGLHWLEHEGEEIIARRETLAAWGTEWGYWRAPHALFAATSVKAESYRYLAPVTPPAEVERLRAEVERLRADAAEWKRLCTIAEPDVAALRDLLRGYMEARRMDATMGGPKPAQWDMSALNRADAAARAAIGDTP